MRVRKKERETREQEANLPEQSCVGSMCTVVGQDTSLWGASAEYDGVRCNTMNLNRLWPVC